MKTTNNIIAASFNSKNSESKVWVVFAYGHPVQFFSNPKSALRYAFVLKKKTELPIHSLSLYTLTNEIRAHK